MSRKTILIAEDDSSLSLLLQYRFELEKYNVLTADDGQQALQLLEEHPVDIVVCDLFMPKVNGLEVIETMRNHLGLGAPAICLSAAGQEDTVVQAFHMGANDFLSKPFSVDELLIRVKRLIPSF